METIEVGTELEADAPSLPAATESLEHTCRVGSV